MPDQNFHKKAVFFDADGTICDIEKGTPQSAEDAIRKLVENGHEAWLCIRKKPCFCAGLSGEDSFYRNGYCLRLYH